MGTSATDKIAFLAMANSARRRLLELKEGRALTVDEVKIINNRIGRGFSIAEAAKEAYAS